MTPPHNPIPGPRLLDRLNLGNSQVQVHRSSRPKEPGAAPEDGVLQAQREGAGGQVGQDAKIDQPESSELQLAVLFRDGLTTPSCGDTADSNSEEKLAQWGFD